MTRKIEISQKTIVFTTLLVLSLWFLFFIRDILVQLYVALVIMLVLNPVVSKLEKARIPRAASVLIVYLTLISLLIFTVAAMVPVLVEQTTSFTNALPKYLYDLHIPGNVIESATREATSQLANLPGQFLRITISIFSNLLSIVAVFLFGLYFSLARKNLSKHLSSLLPDKKIEEIQDIFAKLEYRLSGWARGQVILMVIVGFATFVGLTLLGVPYALPLSLLAGVLEAVPNLGPTIAAVPSVIVGFGVSPITGVATIALGILIQQLENYLLVPRVMQKSAGVHPIVTLVALVVGFRVAGIVGAVLSVPTVLVILVLFQELYSKKSHNS